jgi:mRNA interferase MazF
VSATKPPPLNPSRGDVFMAKLDPTQGSEQAGTRPVAVVSRNAINHNSSVVVVVPMSDRANFEKIYPSQVLIRKGTGGLPFDSVAMCEQVRAITVSRLNRYIGHIPDGIMQEIDSALRITLALSRP